MEFEFDEIKSKTNYDKHGIDFQEAQHLWNDPNRVVIPARTVDEPRAMIVGKLAQKHWSGIYTYRRDRIRIISVRRSRPEEVAIYEG